MKQGAANRILAGRDGRISRMIRAIFLASAFAVLMVLMGPVQETGDDAMMAWQLSRGGGSLASFISPYLSLAMSGLYQKVPPLPWWSILHVFGAWVLLVVMCSEIERIYRQRDRVILYPVIFAAVWLAVMRRVNFTRTAVAFSLAGVILCLKYIHAKQEKEAISPCVLGAGAALFALGLMVRFRAGLMVLPFAAALLLVRRAELRRAGVRISCAEIGSVLVIAAITAASVLAELQFWNTHPDWRAYHEYSSARSDIVDYTEYYPTWEQAKEQYLALGLHDENDLDILLNKAYIGDPDVYSLETLRGIGRLRGKSLGAWRELRKAIHTVFKMLKEGTIFLWLLLWTLYLACKRRKHPCVSYLCLLLVSFAVLLYFSFSGRMMLRVWEPLLLSALCLGMLCSGAAVSVEETEQEGRMGRRDIVFAGLILFLAFYTGMVQSIVGVHIPRKSDDRDEVTRARAECIQAMPDKIFLLSQPLFHHPPAPSPFGIWETIPQSYMENYFALSNWEMNTPTNRKRLENLGISNPTRALLERTDTYSEFMDDKLYRFLKSHYGGNITCSFVGEFPDGGAIVQYTAPLLDAPASSEADGPAITIIKSEEDLRYGIVTWNIQGKLEGWSSIADCRALYCDMIKADGQEYAFRLAFEEDGSFHAFFYDISAEWMETVTEAKIVALGKDGVYQSIGKWK